MTNEIVAKAIRAEYASRSAAHNCCNSSKFDNWRGVTEQGEASKAKFASHNANRNNNDQSSASARKPVNQKNNNSKKEDEGPNFTNAEKAQALESTKRKEDPKFLSNTEKNDCTKELLPKVLAAIDAACNLPFDKLKEKMDE